MAAKGSPRAPARARRSSVTEVLALLALPLLLAGPACSAPSVPLPAHEPLLTRGPTELVAGLYVQGGAYIVGCPQEPRGPYAGTLTVRGARTGRLVARETLTRPARLFVVALPPGRYTVSATGAGGLRTQPQTVTIPRHTTVRQDVFIDVP
jgi:hypothetical protein